MKIHRSLFALFSLMLMLAAAGPRAVHASDERDHDRARQALESGQVLPLRTVLERVERDYPGQVMEVELERKDGRWIYEVKLLRAGGALLKLKVDARDGMLLDRKERGISDPLQSGERR